MFSLIITIISIALVAALALSTLYYGGSAFNKSADEAQAAKILSQGQQLLGAADLYKTETGNWPANMETLLSSQYLKSVPVANGPVATASAAAELWTMPAAGRPVFVLSQVTSTTCAIVNKKSYGVDGILKQLHSNYISQCYAKTSSDFKTVFSKSSEELLLAAGQPSAVPILGLIVVGSVPTDLESAAWEKKPGNNLVPLPAASEVFELTILPTFYGRPAPDYSTQGSFASGYQVVAAERGEALIRIRNTTSESQPLSVTGGSLFRSFIYSADDLASYWGYSLAELDVEFSWSGFPLCRNSGTLAAGDSCTLYLSLDSVPRYPQATVGGAQLSVVSPSGLSLFRTVWEFYDYYPTLVWAQIQAPIQRYRVTNLSGRLIRSPVISLTGDSVFTQTHDCPQTLAFNAFCNVDVTFRPAATADYATTLSVAWEGLAAQTIAIGGKGALPTLITEFVLVPGPGPLEVTINFQPKTGSLAELQKGRDSANPNTLYSIEGSGTNAYVLWADPDLLGTGPVSKILPAACGVPYAPCLTETSEPRVLVFSMPTGTNTLSGFQLIDGSLDRVSTWCIALGEAGVYGQISKTVAGACQ